MSPLEISVTRAIKKSCVPIDKNIDDTLYIRTRAKDWPTPPAILEAYSKSSLQKTTSAGIIRGEIHRSRRPLNDKLDIVLKIGDEVTLTEMDGITILKSGQELIEFEADGSPKTLTIKGVAR